MAATQLRPVCAMLWALSTSTLKKSGAGLSSVAVVTSAKAAASLAVSWLSTRGVRLKVGAVASTSTGCVMVPLMPNTEVSTALTSSSPSCQACTSVGGSVRCHWPLACTVVV